MLRKSLMVITTICVTASLFAVEPADIKPGDVVAEDVLQSAQTFSRTFGDLDRWSPGQIVIVKYNDQYIYGVIKKRERAIQNIFEAFNAGRNLQFSIQVSPSGETKTYSAEEILQPSFKHKYE